MARALQMSGRRTRAVGPDDAFTLTEMTVALAVLAIAVLLLSGLIIGISGQTSAERFSVQALSQAQLAGQTLVQYLRGATEIMPASPSGASAPVVASATTDADHLTVVASAGYNTSTFTSGSTVVCAQWIGPSSPVGDAKFQVTFDCGTGSQRTVATYYAMGTQTQAVFTYEKYSSSGGGQLVPLTEPIPACAYSEIVAVALHVTFLAGPQRPAAGYSADEATTLDTVVYLQGDGLTGTGGSTTTTTSTTKACSE